MLQTIFFHGEGLNRFVLVCNYFHPKFWVTGWRIIATGIKIYFNDRDLLLGTRFILHLRRQQPVVNGAEENEGRKRRGGWGWITRPFLLGIWGGLGSKRGRKIPALVRASRLALPCQQVDHQRVRAGLNLHHLSGFSCCSSAFRRGVCAARGAQPLSFLLSWCHISSGDI